MIPRTVPLRDGEVALCHLSEGRRGPRLVCFPFAGGSPLAFRPLSAALPADWNLTGFDAPGHVRTRGEPLRSVDAMAELFVEVAPDGFFDGATLYGHSLGACVAFAVTRLLEEAGARPRALVLAAAPAPKTRVVPWLTDLDDRALLQALIDMGQFPREAPELFDLFRHAIRADLEAAERYQPPEEKLKTPALLLAATDDGLYRTSQIEAWRDHLEHSTFRTVAGGHLFVTARPVDVAGELVGFTEPA